MEDHQHKNGQNASPWWMKGMVHGGCSVRPSACEVRGWVRKEKREAMTFHVMPDRLR